MDPFQVIIRPISSESALEKIDKENKLTFICNTKATKGQVRWAVEKLYDVRVERVWTYITVKGDKKAIVRLSPEFPASEIAVKIGLL
jgi:large subunit ribosomal protein L23